MKKPATSDSSLDPNFLFKLTEKIFQDFKWNVPDYFNFTGDVIEKFADQTGKNNIHNIFLVVELLYNCLCLSVFRLHFC